MDADQLVNEIERLIDAKLAVRHIDVERPNGRHQAAAVAEVQFAKSAMVDTVGELLRREP